MVIAISGQCLPIFIQVVLSLRIPATIFLSRLASRSSRLLLSSFGRERRNISSACWEAWKESMRPLKPARSLEDEGLGCDAIPTVTLQSNRIFRTFGATCVY